MSPVRWYGDASTACIVIPMTTTKYPNITAKLTGQDGNAFAIIAAVTKALKRNGVDAATVSEFVAEATSGDYDHLLRTAMRWVDVG